MRQVVFHPRLDSSNRLAKELVKQGVLPGTVVRAGEQSAGRGQYDRAFSSPPGGLYFSLILFPDIPPQETAMVTLAAGLGCRDALTARCGLAPLIKWPNDLYWADKKIAGILAECCLSPDGPDGGQGGAAVIVGVGINVNSRAADFPEDLRGILGTVREATGIVHDLDALLEACASGIEERVDQLIRDRTRFLAEWREADYLAGRPVRHFVKETAIAAGVGQGLDEQGRYLLRRADGSITPVLGGQLRPAPGCDFGIEENEQ